MLSCWRAGRAGPPDWSAQPEGLLRSTQTADGPHARAEASSALVRSLTDIIWQFLSGNSVAEEIADAHLCGCHGNGCKYTRSLLSQKVYISVVAACPGSGIIIRRRTDGRAGSEPAGGQ